MSRDAFIRQADDEAPRPYMRFVNPYGTIYLHPRTEDFPTLWAQYLNMTMERRDAAYGHPTRALPHEAQPDVPDQHQHELPVQGGWFFDYLGRTPPSCQNSPVWGDALTTGARPALGPHV